MSKLGRNDPCRCGSGEKYKRCCIRLDELEAKEKRLEAEEALRRATRRRLSESEFEEFRRLVDEAQEHIKSGRLEEAEAVARKLDAGYPDEPIGAERLGRIYEARGMALEAAEHYRRAVGLMGKLGEGGYGDCCLDALVKTVGRLDPDPPSPSVERAPVGPVDVGHRDAALR